MDLNSDFCKGEMRNDGREQAEEGGGGGGEEDGKPEGAAAAAAPPTAAPKYRECRRNHAATMGLNALDGCGEFMPSGNPGTLEALRCAACSCHRNFHRRDSGASGDHAGAEMYQLPLFCGAAAINPSKLQYSILLHTPPAPGPRPGQDRQNALTATSPPWSPSPSAPVRTNASPAAEVGQPRKRRRTTFTPEQKEEMRRFADKVGWSIKRRDAEELREFCTRIGVGGQVLRVWMHNNKATLSGTGGGGSENETPVDAGAEE